MNAQKVRKVFGKEASMMFVGGQVAVKAHKVRKFEFLDHAVHASLIEENPETALATYYKELLYRSYLAANVAVLRSDNWLKNLMRAQELGEVLLFCASLRGLLESTGDALDITGYLLQTLAEQHEVLCSALQGKPSSIVAGGEFEEKLIHFTHASKLSKSERESYPESHSAKQIYQYIQNLETAGVNEAKECYSEMCDFTHPGRSSLLPWMEEKGDFLNTHARSDKKLIAGILKRYSPIFPHLFRAIYNPGLMTLGLLNHYPVPEIHTPSLLKVSWNSAPGWEKALIKLRTSSHYRPDSYAAR